MTLAVPLADLLARAAEQLVASLGGLRKRSPYHLAVAKFLQIGLKELWVAFGTGKNYRHIEVHQIVSGIGAEKSQALAFFRHLQAATRCHSSQTVGISLLGRHGRHIPRLQTPSTH